MRRLLVVTVLVTTIGAGVWCMAMQHRGLVVADKACVGFSGESPDSGLCVPAFP
jgi:hypothetical protein